MSFLYLKTWWFSSFSLPTGCHFLQAGAQRISAAERLERCLLEEAPGSSGPMAASNGPEKLNERSHFLGQTVLKMSESSFDPIFFSYMTQPWKKFRLAVEEGIYASEISEEEVRCFAWAAVIWCFLTERPPVVLLGNWNSSKRRRKFYAGSSKPNMRRWVEFTQWDHWWGRARQALRPTLLSLEAAEERALRACKRAEEVTLAFQMKVLNDED